MARSRGRNTILLWTSAGQHARRQLQADRAAGVLFPGRIFQFVGSRAQFLYGPHYAIARAIYFRKIGSGGEGFFEFPAYIGMSFEVGNTWQQPRRHELWLGAQGRIGVHGVRHVSRSGVPGTGYDQAGTAVITCSSAELSRRFAPPFNGVGATPRMRRGPRGLRWVAPELARNCGFRRAFRLSRIPARADRRFASIRACGTCPRGHGRARRR